MPADEGTGWRLFIAIALLPEVRTQLERPRSTLARLSEVVRASAPDSIHLTLHFLGQVDASQVERLSERLRPVVEAVPRFSLEVGGVGSFPSPGRPSVIWVGIGGPGRDRMVALQAAIGTMLTDMGFTPDRRPYAPHLTLGRLRRPPKAAERVMLRHWLEEWKEATFGRMRVDAVSLMRSQLGGGPPRYTTLATFPLQ